MSDYDDVEDRPDELGELTRQRLMAHAKQLGLEVNVRMTKDDLLAAIAAVEDEGARAAPDQPVNETVTSGHLGWPGQIGHPAP